MRKYIYKSMLFSIIIVLGLNSCKKDLGNYNLKEFNKVSFLDVDTVNGYQVYLGDTLKLSLQLEGSIDKILSGSYSYEWKIRHGLFGERPTVDPEEVIATTRNLSHPINWVPGTYALSLSVTDKATGISFIQVVRITVITPYYQGWLVLEKVKDTSRLDFISYLNNNFKVEENILARLNPNKANPGNPYQVVFFRNTFFTNMTGVYLLTSAGGTKLDVENFRYSEDGDIAKSMIGGAPAGFKPEKMYYTRTSSQATYDNLLMYSKGNLYFQVNGPYSSAPINTSGITGKPFRISSGFTSSGGTGNARLVMYNEDEKRFYTAVRSGTYQFSAASPLDAALNFPTGKELLYMDDNNVPSTVGTNYAYAVLKDPADSKKYMFRFSYKNNDIQPNDYYQEITGTDIDKAEYFAVSPELGYLFYSAGGKLYEYDLFLKTSKLMLDKGNEKISMLFFDPSYVPAQWKNSIMVGSYDPAGIPGKNGTLAQYSIPPVNGPLTEQNKWGGLGQVVSVSYRFR